MHCNTTCASGSLFQLIVTPEYNQGPFFPTSTCDMDAINHTCRLFNKYANFDQLNGVTGFVSLINNERLCLIAAVFIYKLFKVANNNAERARRI